MGLKNLYLRIESIYNICKQAVSRKMIKSLLKFSILFVLGILLWLAALSIENKASQAPGLNNAVQVLESRIHNSEQEINNLFNSDSQSINISG